MRMRWERRRRRTPSAAGATSPTPSAARLRAGAGGESGRGRAPTPDFRTQRLVGTPLSEEHQSGLPLRPLYGWVYLLIACPASAIIIVLEPTLYYCILGNW